MAAFSSFLKQSHTLNWNQDWARDTGRQREREGQSPSLTMIRHDGQQPPFLVLLPCPLIPPLFLWVKERRKGNDRSSSMQKWEKSGEEKRGESCWREGSESWRWKWEKRRGHFLTSNLYILCVCVSYLTKMSRKGHFTRANNSFKNDLFSGDIISVISY